MLNIPRMATFITRCPGGKKAKGKKPRVPSTQANLFEKGPAESICDFQIRKNADA